MATPDDLIYLLVLLTPLFCHLCHNNGRPKTRKKLWSLKRHYQQVHPNECREEWERLIDNLYELIKRGIIR